MKRNVTTAEPQAPSGRATIADVAAAAGVSLGTASRVMNGKSSEIRISDATARRVMEAAETLSYRKNVFASGLRGQKAGVIGVIVRDLHDPFLLSLVEAVQDAAQARDTSVLIGHADYSSRTADRQIRFMLDHWFDGLVLLGNLPDEADLRGGLTRSGLPCVAVACNDDHLLDSVATDDGLGSALAFDHLIGMSHSRVGFVGDLSLAGVSRRLEVYRDYRRDGRLEGSAEWVAAVPNRRDVRDAEFSRLLDGPDRPTAVFCASDFLALRLVGAAGRAGLRVPDDLSVVGFDDIPEAASARPALTTVRQPVATMAEAALDLLRTGRGRGHTSAVLAPELVARSTTSPPAVASSPRAARGARPRARSDR